MGQIKHPTIWKFEHTDKDGNVLWESDWMENALTDAGEEAILNQVFSKSVSAVTTWYMGLINDSTIAETDTLATMVGEPSGNGYARQVTTFGDSALDAGDHQTTSTQETFTASGGAIGPVDHAILCDVVSGSAGVLYVYVPLSVSRTMNDGDSLNCTVAVKLA